MRGGLGSDAVLGEILAISSTGANVSIDVIAGGGLSGGRILQENRSHGAPATPARIHGESNGGAVRTSILFGIKHATSENPDGGSLEIRDVASGDTTGDLTLEQTAIAGSGHFGDLGTPRLGGVREQRSLQEHGVLGADAAFGRDRRLCGSRAALGAVGWRREASAVGSNSAGAVHVFAQAKGGAGIIRDDAIVAAGRAGSAAARASADGASGFARAEATTGSGALPQLRAQSEALVGSRLMSPQPRRATLRSRARRQNQSWRAARSSRARRSRKTSTLARAGNAALSQSYAAAAQSTCSRSRAGPATRATARSRSPPISSW